MAKRYGELADALEEMSLHYELDGRSRLSSKYQFAASELRQAEFLPPDPSTLNDVSYQVRDSIAEWRAFGKIPELEEMREANPYLAELTRIAKVGPVTAKQLHEEAGAETIEDVRELSEHGELEDITGIGPKTATTIRRSIAQL